MTASIFSTYQNWLANLAKSTPDLILLSSQELAWTGLDVAVLKYASKEVFAPGFSSHLIVIHPKSIPHLIRKIDGKIDSGAIKSGESSIISAGCENEWNWQNPERCSPLHLALDDAFLGRVALEDGYRNCERLEIINQFTVLDPQIQQIGLALKAELESGGLTGRLFAESLATALAIRLLRQYSTFSQPLTHPEGGLSKHKLQIVKNYINDNLNADLRLIDISALVGLSSSHLTRLFRQSMGIPPYQYVIQCRVERARQMLVRGDLTIGEIAGLVGFNDQSHFTFHFKRIIGVTPKRFLQQ